MNDAVFFGLVHGEVVRDAGEPGFWDVSFDMQIANLFPSDALISISGEAAMYHTYTRPKRKKLAVGATPNHSALTSLTALCPYPPIFLV